MNTTTTSARAQAFAQRVLNAFADVGRSTDALVAAAKGPSTTTMTKLRSVAKGESDMAEPREPTWTKIDLAANWTPGSARRVCRGGEPEMRSSVGEGLDRVPEEYSELMHLPVKSTPLLLLRLQERIDELERLVDMLVVVALGDQPDQFRDLPEDVVETLRARRNWVVHSTGSGKTASFLQTAARQAESGGRIYWNRHAAAGEEPDPEGPEGGA